ncbi:MAG: DPP IV N-terminal domain-containing protein, partial [Tannerellaceae bacterium]
MKKIFLSFIALLSLQNITSQNGTKPLQLKQIVNGEFSQKSVGEMRSLPDGIHYTAMNPARTMIIKYAYKTGEPVDTLFNVKKARECAFDKFDGYEINSTGHRILLWKDTESIYRRSKLAQYYDFDVRRNMVSKLTENETKQTAPLFSPDG